MIELISEHIEMPKINYRRYLIKLIGLKWVVSDSINDNNVVFSGKFEDTSIACLSLNKKYYKQFKNKKMDLSEKQKTEFDELAERLIKFLAENLHPHCTCIINSTSAEIVEGVYSVSNDKYIVD